MTYNGSPVADATVSFHPVGTHRSAFARTNAAGEYQLSTVAENDGAMPGEYQVSVTKVVNAAATEPAADIAAPTKPPEYKSLLPEKYAKPETSKLTAVVKSGGSQVFDLQLTD